jgi:SAM-dependent methyltransferase
VKCSDCGLLYVTPRPSDEELVRAHECGVHRGEITLNVTGSFNESKVSSYLKVLQGLYGDELRKSDRTWLDIGCGHGEFLIAVEQFSQNRVLARGIEPNRYKRESAKNRGLDVSYFDLKNHKERYDSISILNVYSHLPSPLEFFCLCKGLLNPGGELLIETGDTADLSPKEHHRPFYLPDHLSFASEKIISEILHRCGFQVICIKKYQNFSFNFYGLLIGMIKHVWQGKRSQILEPIVFFKKNQRYIRDMYIRARWSGEPIMSGEKIF